MKQNGPKGRNAFLMWQKSEKTKAKIFINRHEKVSLY